LQDADGSAVPSRNQAHRHGCMHARPNPPRFPVVSPKLQPLQPRPRCNSTKAAPEADPVFQLTQGR
jgi:hypothetical protein